ncbi:MAG: hypothetical protein JWM33_1876 [Caulobacteraceae bacterium]|nr:hypothetical protein [Caulobacteraceae bacterium]
MHDCAAPMTLRLEQMFDDQAQATPQAPAIQYRGTMISYGRLAAQVQALAHQLQNHGVGPGVLVAVATRRRPATVALLLAILRAGGAYLPLDARYPPERLAFVLADSGAGLWVGEPGAAAPEGFGGVALDLAADGLKRRPGGTDPAANLPTDLAYVIYTSGSTGAPKGVMLGHGATHLVDWAREAFEPQDRARLAATTSLCFDPSIFEIFMPLCTGGALILKDSALEPFAEDEQPTMLDTTPGVLAQLCRSGAISPSLRVINVGGEALRRDLAQAVYRDHPDLALYNHYGPTEATTCATVGRVARDGIGEPSIGVAVRGARILLLDADGEPVRDETTGEIHIGGAGLALGYLGQPALTAARFVEGRHGRLYRTGDLGFWREGELYFAGRSDRQVKIRGFRIELGEVEAAMMRLPGAQAAIAAVKPAPGGAQLVGYVQSPGPLTPAQARDALSAWLPDYMVPARLVVAEALPLLPSGKVDHQALDRAEHQPAARVNEPITSTEKAIIHVFEEVLARCGIGPNDAFFDLGGDSLSCLTAALRLGEVLGYELPSALIPQAPTPRALAAALDHGRLRTSGHLSRLQAGGDGTPLFCIADLFGHAFNYLSLAAELGGDRPVHGLSPGPLQARFARDGDLDALARAYLAQLREMQPHGPYLIAGYSAGGLLAVELAARLEAEGEAVRLVLLDSRLHSRLPPAAGLGRWLLAQARARLAPGGPRPPSWIPRSQVAFAARMIRAGLSHRPPRFGGPALVIRARDPDPIDGRVHDDGLLGWSGVLAGEVTPLTVAGDHHQFLRRPLVAETANAVRRFLADGGLVPPLEQGSKPLTAPVPFAPTARWLPADGR